MDLLKKIKLLLFSYGLIILLAIGIGLIYFLPNVLIPYFLVSDGNTTYDPILNIDAPILDEVGSYGVKIKEVIEGRWQDGDPYLIEYKNRPSIWGNYYMSLAIGSIFRLLGITNTASLLIWGDFIFPFIATTLAFAIIYVITKKKSWSALGAVVLIAFPNVSAINHLFKVVVSGDWGADSFFSALGEMFDNHLTRILVPSFSLCLFLGFLAIFLLFLKNPKRYMFWAGTALGLLFYVYFYYWGFIVVTIALLFLSFCLTKNREMTNNFFKISLIAMIISAPFWLHFYRQSIDPTTSALQARAGLVLSHAPYIGSIDNYIFAIFALTLTWIAERRGFLLKNYAWFVTAILLSTFLVLNIQVITGFNPQPDHWGSRINIYMLVLSLIVALFSFFKIINKENVLRWLPLIGLPVLFYSALVFQVKFSLISRFEYQSFIDIKESFVWINEHLPKDAVVVSPIGKINVDLAFLTNSNIYMPYINFSLASDEEIESRFFETLRAFNVTDEFFAREIINARLVTPLATSSFYFRGGKEIDPSFIIYGDAYNTRYSHNYFQGGRIKPEAMTRLIDVYRNYPIFNDKVFQMEYQADYLFHGPYERLVGRQFFSEFENLELVYNHNLVKIYKIIK